MALVGDIVDIMVAFAGKTVFFDGDNVGLLCGKPDDKVSGVLCCLDVTDDVVDQAVAMNANLIISHHPLIFSPIRSIRTDLPLGRLLERIISLKINVFSAHTNLDFCAGGVNDYAAKVAGLLEIEPLDEGFGRVGNVKPISLGEFGARLATSFDCPSMIIGDKSRIIDRVVFVNGAGGGDTEYIDTAIKMGAGCFVTAEVKHHVALYAISRGVCMVELSHFATEYCFVARLSELVGNECKKKGLDVEVFAAKESNPKSVL